MDGASFTSHLWWWVQLPIYFYGLWFMWSQILYSIFPGCFIFAADLFFCSWHVISNRYQQANPKVQSEYACRWPRFDLETCVVFSWNWCRNCLGHLRASFALVSSEGSVPEIITSFFFKYGLLMVRPTSSCFSNLAFHHFPTVVFPWCSLSFPLGF